MLTVSFKLLILTIDSKFLELKNKKEIRLIKYTFLKNHNLFYPCVFFNKHYV